MILAGNINYTNIIVTLVIGVAAIITVGYFLRKLTRNSDKIHRRFIGKLLYLIIIIICVTNIIEVANPDLKISSAMLKGSALIVAILGFAAQPVISDLICGFLISIHKPFEIGDRIIVEGMDPGIVEDITLRHTVLRIYDNLKVIVPNSVLNSKTLVNTSYKNDRRGIHLTYSVSYDTDLSLAIDTIRDCVADSPYTLGVETNGIKEDSGPVYFLKFADSALLLETTIWVPMNANSYVATTDVNIRVNKAFRERGIEIPYNFINVVQRENHADEMSENVTKKKKTAPSKRSKRTDTVSISSDSGDIANAMSTVRGFADKQRLTEHARLQLELMTEEIIGIMGSIAQSAKAKFWVEGSGQKYMIHLTFPASVGSEEYRKLISLSTTGRNEAVNTIAAKIWEKMVSGIRSNGSDTAKESDYEWSLTDSGQKNEIGESILASMADDIKVSVTKEHVELVVIKSVNGKD